LSGEETLRWPTNLDRQGIEKRLVLVRESAAAAGLTHVAELFAGLEGFTSAQVGANVVAALTWLQDKPENRAITTHLEMIAMNLKNLR
jgi:hypothetical protein